MRKSRTITKMSAEEEEMMSYDGSNGSYIDSDDDCEYIPMKRQRTISNVDEQMRLTQRKPTRVPNLKIQNRNAVLARENRLRKKQMMEEMEKTVEELQEQNRKLLKMMKFKDRKNEELTKEVRYLKSVIANRTEIVSVLKSLPNAMPSSRINDKVPASSCASSDTLSIAEDIENGIKDADPFLPSLTDEFSFFPLDIATDWDEILKNPLNSDIPSLQIESPASSPTSSGVSSEHNYSHYENEKFLETISDEHEMENGAGVCVHINRGKVSLEFCVVCHNNASTTAWMDD